MTLFNSVDAGMSLCYNQPMKWNKNLYLGDVAGKNQRSIIKKIKKYKLQMDTYIITLPVNNSDVLEIYPAFVLLQKNEIYKNLEVVGIAVGKIETNKLIEKIIMDTYNKTGKFDVRSFLCKI